MTLHFDITAPALPNGTLIEASAGTGKTHAVAAYVTRELALRDDLRVGEILVTTYTRNAAAELRERIRTRLVVAAQLLRGRAVPAGYRPDELDGWFAQRDDTADCARRLERAAAEFDTAVIGTIHGVCARVLRLAGIQAADTGDEELRDRVLDEVINDTVVTETLAGRPWSPPDLRAVVAKRLGDPFLELVGDPGDGSAEQGRLLAAAPTVVERCVARVRERMRASPSFDDLLVRAWEEVTPRPEDSPATAAGKRTLLATLQGRFKLAIVDEAQDTNRLQWEFLHALFPAAGPRPLLAVGDPKQAIYRFRGADVTAYLEHAQEGVAPEGDGPPRRTLSVNRRSDGLLLDGLNAVMATARLGSGIEYRTVAAAPGREPSRLAGLRPVEFLETPQPALVSAAVRKVHELLTAPLVAVDGGRPRPFLPGEVCVLVRSNERGAAVATRLGDLGIPAVTTGTASVMAGEMANDIRVLLEAMERPSDPGRTRRLAATSLFGVPLAAVAMLDEAAEQRVQERVAALHRRLQAQGIAAVAAEIMADEVMATRIAGGPGGERRIVDFSHVVELLHDAAEGRGCTAGDLLEHHAALAARDAMSDLVSRRVESDAAAVRIMTVHAAKGLEFPAVVVADGWGRRNSPSQPPIHSVAGVRRLDIGAVVPGLGTSAAARTGALAAENEEIARLIYVAVTRAQHHVCILRVPKWRESVLGEVMPGAPDSPSDIAPAVAAALAVRALDELPRPARWEGSTPDDATEHLRPAPLPPPVTQTIRRTSYTGITSRVARRTEDPHAAVGGASDEGGIRPAEPLPPAGDAVAEGPSTERESPAAALARVHVPELPAGTAFGSLVHEIFERLEPAPADDPAAIAAAARRGVDRIATSLTEPERTVLAGMIETALRTPFGGPAGAGLRDLRLADFTPEDRLTELRFELAVAPFHRGVLASHVGRVLREALPADDPLASYARRLAGPAFDVSLAGLVNGSIDAVLRIPGRPDDDPRLVIADYKTNRLHGRDDAVPLAAYAPDRLHDAMADHDYPLQALVYGTAVWRLLRWRLGRRKPAGWDPEECIAGIVYAFIRGMRGPETPADAAGRRYGVFTWTPPHGLFRRLSDLFAGDLPGGGR